MRWYGLNHELFLSYSILSLPIILVQWAIFLESLIRIAFLECYQCFATVITFMKVNFDYKPWQWLTCLFKTVPDLTVLARCLNFFLHQRKNSTIIHLCCLLWSSSLFGVVQLASACILLFHIICQIGEFFSICRPSLAPPPLWPKYLKFPLTATNCKFTTWNQFQTFYLFNLSWNNEETGHTCS